MKRTRLFHVLKFYTPLRALEYNRSNFPSEVMKVVCSLLGIKRTPTSICHPQGNGQTERLNRTLEAMLAKSVEEHQGVRSNG